MTFDEFLVKVADANTDAALASYADAGQVYHAMTREHRFDADAGEPYDIVRRYHYSLLTDTVSAEWYSDYGYGDFDPYTNHLPVNADWCDEL